MVEETANTIRAEIDHLRRLGDLVTDAGVRAEIRKMIEELERRLREIEPKNPL
jgi:transcription elongation GreA/GreB family factor